MAAANLPAIYAPRMFARIFVPMLGTADQRLAQAKTSDVFELHVRPVRAALVYNNYNEADELRLLCTYDEAGLDPRYLRSAEVWFYLQDAQPTAGQWTPGPANLRFVGIARDVRRKFTQNEKTVEILFHDYTTLFLEAKSFPPSGIPLYTDTLRTAWNRICDNTGYWNLDTKTVVSTVQNLKTDGSGGPQDPLQFIGVDGDTQIGSAMPQRLAKLGKLQVPTHADAWAVWRSTCEALGLITFIRGPQCVVTTATDYYTATDPPRLIYGLNVLELEEARELGHLSAKNVCVRSFDPLAGATLESFYPEPTAKASKRKRLGASALGNVPALQVQDFELIDLPFAVADKVVLDRIAARIWEERTRQELRGTLTTGEMSVATVAGSQFDLLQLQAGDQVQIEISRSALDLVQQQPSIQARSTMLIAKGYSPDMAGYIAANLDSIDKLPPQFLVHSIEHEIDASGTEGGCKYQTRLEFLNRVKLTDAGPDADSGDSGTVTNQAQGSDVPYTGKNVEQ